MKGIVFAEFLELVEEKFGLEVVDRILQASTLPSGGVCIRVWEPMTTTSWCNLLGSLARWSAWLSQGCCIPLVNTFLVDLS
jgi:hypothetical protein